MSEQPALKDDVTAAWVPIEDLVKAERERDEALADCDRACSRANEKSEDVWRQLRGALAERDEALAALARVRALAEECDRREAEDEPRAPWRMLAAAIRFRAALEGP